MSSVHVDLTGAIGSTIDKNGIITQSRQYYPSYKIINFTNQTGVVVRYCIILNHEEQKSVHVLNPGEHKILGVNPYGSPGQAIFLFSKDEKYKYGPFPVSSDVNHFVVKSNKHGYLTMSKYYMSDGIKGNWGVYS